MTFLAYGDDALTLYALVERRAEVLSKLGDDTDPTDAMLIYRPSFGRRAAGGGPAPSNRTPSAQFGEFDAILATARGTYLIESKQRGASEVRDGLGCV